MLLKCTYNLIITVLRLDDCILLALNYYIVCQGRGEALVLDVGAVFQHGAGSHHEDAAHAKS